MGCLWKLIRYIFYLLLVLLLAAACYAGNAAYEYVWKLPWDQVLSLENRRDQLSRIQYLERYYAWPEVQVRSKDGTSLTGTYVEGKGHRYVILLHGLYQNRSMMIPYIRIYRDLGYHILLADLRGHGQSGGVPTDWGIHDEEDLHAWVSWLKARDPEAQIGIHGVSLGAAMALIYAGSEEGRQLRFCVADSSYGDLMELGREKIMAYTEDQSLIWGMDLLNPFFQGALYFHTGRLLRDIDPMDRVRAMTAPVLFLHGGADTLVPPDVSEKLCREAGSSNKKAVIFEGSAHTMEFHDRPQTYTRTVRDFIKDI